MKRSVNVYLKLFSMCNRCNCLGEIDSEPGCINTDSFFDFRTGEYCGGFSPKGSGDKMKLRGREARESRKIHDLDAAGSNPALATKERT